MQKITYYQYMSWDGGDRNYPKEPAFFELKDMKEFLKNNKYDTYDKRTVVIYDSVEDYRTSISEETKEKALAKLTDKEKKALGLL